MSGTRVTNPLSLCLVLTCAALAACSKPVVFQGATTLAVTGTPPPAAEPPPRVEVRDNRIEIHEKIQFEHDKATIMPVSFGLLDEITSVIQKNAHIKKIQIEGYASSEGSASHNQELSEARARAVLTYLTEHGIAKAVLVSKGFGIDKPIADNATEEGREKNRRVEFNILEQDVTQQRVEIDPKTGKERRVEDRPQPVKPGHASSAAITN